jgi:hypothetical protein
MLSARMAHAKNPVAYGLIEKVTLEPATDGVQRVQVWGVFALFDEESKTFRAPERGYLFFEFPTDSTAAGDARGKLLAAAGTSKVVGLLGRPNDPEFTYVRRSDEKHSAQGASLEQVFQTIPFTDFAPVRALLAFH